MTKLYHIRFMRDKDFRVETSPNGADGLLPQRQGERRRLSTRCRGCVDRDRRAGAVCRWVRATETEMTFDPDHCIGFDMETSVRSGLRLTALAVASTRRGRRAWCGCATRTRRLWRLRPTLDDMVTCSTPRELRAATSSLERAVRHQWADRYGLGELVMKVKWLDGMLLWRHARIEPVRLQRDRRSATVSRSVCANSGQTRLATRPRRFPQLGPGGLGTLHHYNGDDVRFTIRGVKHW